MKILYKILIVAFIGLLYLAIPISLFAQANIKKAELLMQKFEYVEATETYLEYFKKNQPSYNDLRNISYCYIVQNDTRSATEWMQNLIDSYSPVPEDVKMFAELLKSEGRYLEAKKYYLKYADMNPEDSEFSDSQIKSCEKAIEWINEPEYFTVTNIEQLNSEKSDFGLIPYGDKFLLTSDRLNTNKLSKKDIYGWTGNPYLSLYLVDFNVSDFLVKNINLIDELNDEFHNGPAVYDESNKTVYFTRTKTVKQNQKPINSDPTSWLSMQSKEIYTNRLEIYSSKLANGIWTEVKEFDNNNADLYSVGHPTLSLDHEIIYFTSDMPDGFGGTDIWYSEKTENGTWGLPKNAGKDINTAGKEMFPYIDQNGDFYFSSDGHSGMGGLDLFKATGAKNNWSNPENLKYPINSPKDDFSIFIAEPGEFGFISSNRYGGQGSDDIYSFVHSPPPVPTELILVVNTYEKMEDGTITALEGVDVHYHINEGSNLIAIEETSSGKYMTTIDCDAKYLVNGTKEGYFTQAYEFETVCETMHDTVYAKLVLEKIVINKAIVIENIYYDFDKWNIREDAAIELDKIVFILVENPTIIIELGSHTDSRGSDNYNQELSQKRAESAVQYIIDNNIDKNRITAKGYGESVLVNKCSNGVQCSEEEHQMNRRTEFKVTGFSKEQPVIYSTPE